MLAPDFGEILQQVNRSFEVPSCRLSLVLPPSLLFPLLILQMTTDNTNTGLEESFSSRDLNFKPYSYSEAR